MAVNSIMYRICLTIPEDAQQRIHDYAATFSRGATSVRTHSVGQYTVQLMSVVSRSRDVLAKIQQAFDSVQRELQGELFDVATTERYLRSDRIVSLKVHSCRGAAEEEDSEQPSRPLFRLFTMVRTALEQQGIFPEPDTPYVDFVWNTDKRLRFKSILVNKRLPFESRVQWQTSAADLISVGEA